MEMQEFSNVPNKASEFYKQKDDEVIEKEEPKPKKNATKGKENNKDGKNKKNEVDKFLDDHIGIGPTETVVKMQDNIQKYTNTWGSRD